MPIYLLQICADLEGIEQLTPLPNNLWKLDIQSDSSGGDVKKGVTVSSEDAIELDGSKGEANFVMKWPKAKAQSYMRLVDVKKCDMTYKAADSGKFVTVW
jgi:hypothetical protein